MPRHMDVETWPSFLLRLLGRVLKQGAKVLEQQGKTLTRLAEEWADDQKSSAETDDRSESDGHQSSSSDSPPEHWLQKIQETEGPLQWIDHTEGNALTNAPQEPVQSSRSSSETLSESSHENETESPFSSPDRSSGESPRLSSGDEGPTNETSRRDLAGGVEFSESENATASVDREGPRQRRQEETRKGDNEPFSASGEPGSFSRSGSSPSGPLRLRPSSKTPSEQKRRTTDPDPGFAEETISRNTEYTPNASQERGHPSSNTGEADSGDTADTDPQFSSVSSEVASESRGDPFGPERTRSDSNSSSKRSSTDRPGSASKPVAFRRQRRTPSTSSPERERAQRGGKWPDRFPRAVENVEIDDWPDSSRSVQHQKGKRFGAQSSRSPWPTLPDVEEIIEEEASESRGPTREFREWERRRRLNREQRGELWSE